jgi:hypothetical protein
LVLGLSVGCGCARKEPEPDAVGRPTFRRGEVVVVERVAAEFAEARVLSVTDRHLKVQGLEDGEPVTVSRSDAYRIGRGAPRAGTFGICRAGTRPGRWQGCRIVRSAGASVVAAFAGGREDETLPAERVIVPSAVTALNVRRFLEMGEARRAFSEAVAHAGTPQRPAGWNPEAREPVVARRGGRWYSANVDAPVEDGGARVVWLGGEHAEVVGRDSVVPVPPFAHSFVPGEFALARAGTLGEPWRPVRIDAVGPDEAVVSEQSGASERLGIRSLVPLGAAPAPSP